MNNLVKWNPWDSNSTRTNLYYITDDLETVVYLCFTDDDIEVKARDFRTVWLVQGRPESKK